MNINNAVVNGKKTCIKIENGRLAGFSEAELPNAIDAKGQTVIPGLIDVHTHGCAGMDTMDADFEKMCDFYARHGTTCFLPTTMTMSHEALLRVTTAKTDFLGAEIAGFHLEGPYISPKYKGAQNEKYICKPDINEFKEYKRVKMITVAPEIEGSMEFIREASAACAVALGHTDCDCETALRAIDCGAVCLTHTYNAMPPFHHRRPGPIGAAVERRIYAQLICDGFHISKQTVLATYRMFGADRMILISDSIRPAGLPEGEYESGGLRVILKDGAARLADGTIAGSCAMLWDCVKKAVEFGIPFEAAVKMASQAPAELLGLKKGKIEPGYDADLLIVDKNMDLSAVIIGGERFC